MDTGNRNPHTFCDIDAVIANPFKVIVFFRTKAYDKQIPSSYKSVPDGQYRTD